MKEAITESYINAIFHGYQEAGPYYVLAPGLANIFSDDERHPALLKASSIESIQTVVNG